MDAVVALCADIEILIFPAEQPQVHVEAPDLGVREALLHLDGLLDGRDAADFRTLCVAGLDVTGTS